MTDRFATSELGDKRAVSSRVNPCLVRLYPFDVSRGMIELSEGQIRFGRSDHCEVELLDEFISGEHASIETIRGRCLIRDCNSLNGTFVNDVRISAECLEAGDRIRIGNHVFKFLATNFQNTQLHDAAYEMTTLDGLTGARSYRYFEETFAREVMRAQRHWRPIAVMIMDLDEFQSLNARMGFLAGDECLRSFCQRVSSRIRAEDLFARIQDDKFVLAISEAPLKQSVRVAQDLRRLVEGEPFRTSMGHVNLTVSIGLGFANGQGPMTADEILQQAHDKLVRAKAEGRNCVQF